MCFPLKGTNCDVITDHCVTQPCKNEGSCFNTGLGYVCTCQEGFSGICNSSIGGALLLNPPFVLCITTEYFIYL